MRYADGADSQADLKLGKDGGEVPRSGLVFYYPSLDLCKIVECELTSVGLAAELDQLEEWICRMLYIQNEQQPLRQTSNKYAAGQQDRRCSKYCIAASLEVLMRQAKIGNIFEDPTEQTQNSNEHQEEESKGAE